MAMQFARAVPRGAKVGRVKSGGKTGRKKTRRTSAAASAEVEKREKGGRGGGGGGGGSNDDRCCDHPFSFGERCPRETFKAVAEAMRNPTPVTRDYRQFRVPLFLIEVKVTHSYYYFCARE